MAQASDPPAPNLTDGTRAIALTPQLEEDIRRLRHWQKDGRHDEALSGAQALGRDLPENRDLLLIEAFSLRHLRRFDEALATLERLETLHPRFSRLHQERGLCYVALKDAPKAIDALLCCVNLNPALPSSWRMLEGLYRLTGDNHNAATAGAHLEALARLPAEVVTATSLFSDGDLAPAEAIIRAFLLSQGNHPEAMRLLARIGMAMDILDDAEVLLEAVLALAPDYQAARYDYAQTLTLRHKYVRAREEIDRLLALAPANFDYRSLAATTAVGLGDHDGAIKLYTHMLIDAPNAAEVHLWLGHALKTVGKVPEAVEAYRAAAAARPDFGDAYWSLANLKLYRFTAEEMACMRTAEASPSTGVEDRYHLCFALGKALEDLGEFAESWACYGRGNALKRAEGRYRPDLVETNSRLQSETCTAAFFDRRKGWGAPAADPIFIVGLPRSGSTLLEQILASHSKVEGTQELPDIQRIVLELQGRDGDLRDPRYPAAMTEMTQDDFLRLGQKYLADTLVYRSGRPVFIDKMPNNFRHIGLIHLILPKARIIDARREPLSCCLSNLKQLFARGQEFAYSHLDIARYYRTYLDLMRHWDRVLPGRILRVFHEDVVEDLDGEVRRLLNHCGLDFEQACLDFHLTERSVRTPSSEQVRQPIFRDGLDQWKHYEPWLDPLKSALGDALATYRI